MMASGHVVVCARGLGLNLEGKHTEAEPESRIFHNQSPETPRSAVALYRSGGWGKG